MLDKKYLTFSELVDRWNIPSNDVHYLIQQNILVPSIVWDKSLYEVDITDIFGDWTQIHEEICADEDGECIYYECDPPETLYLIKSISNGAYKYIFKYLTRTINPSYKKVLKLCNSFAGADITIDEKYVEEKGFFMMELVQYCEVFHLNQTNTSARLKSKHHVSKMLSFLVQASEKFWENAEEGEPDTHPKNIDVEKWLIERGYSESLARKAATIIRPEWASKGRPKEN